MRLNCDKENAWLLTAQCEESAQCVKQYRFDFSFFRSESLRAEIKAYIWQQLRFESKLPATLRQELCWLRYYEQWLYENEICSLAQITRADAEGFLSYLHVCVSEKTKQPLCMLTQKHIYQTVRGVYRWYACRDRAYVRLLFFFPTDVYARLGWRAHTETERFYLWLAVQADERRKECSV